MPRILLIEDDTDTAHGVQGMLEALGYDVAWMKNGRQALNYAEGNAPVNIVLTDIIMPQTDGLEVIQGLRHVWPNTPVLAMTGYRDASYLKAASVFGAIATLDKPFTLEQLRQSLERVLAH
jgi:CheY-like chemotaxis protein